MFGGVDRVVGSITGVNFCDAMNDAICQVDHLN